MGTSIADLLGAQLPEEWREPLEQRDKGIEQTAEKSQHKDISSEEQELIEEITLSDVAESAPEEVVVTAVLEETNIEPGSMHADLTLEDDLDLSGIALWAVVAQIESELNVLIPDAVVRSWGTLDDMFSSIKSLVAK